MKYLVYCSERQRDGIACWWNPGRLGYTDNVDKAGRYTKAEADEIERGSHGEDCGIAEDEVLAMKLVRICRIDDGTNWQHFKKPPPTPAQRDLKP